MTTPYYANDSVTLYHGNCLDILPELPDNSVDAIVTDPPAGISFMGRQWDHHKGGREQWSAWLADVMREAYRVAKPGAHAFVWALPRTTHWTACGIEDAGWEIRDRVVHLFGTGFPKSLDVSKAFDRKGGNPLAFQTFARAYAAAVDASPLTHTDIDRRLGIKSSSCYWARTDHRGGLPPRHHWETVRLLLDLPEAFEQLYDEAEREVIGVQKGAMAGWSMDGNTRFVDRDITAPATPEAAQWQGWGTALKPAAEDWWLARKPLSEGTVAANVLRWGTGALNIDACRIGDEPLSAHGGGPSGVHRIYNGDKQRGQGIPPQEPGSNPRIGRWPANVALDESQAAALDQMSGELTSGNLDRSKITAENGIYGKAPAERVGTYEANSGGASRFFLTVESDPFPPPVCVLHGMLSICESANGAATKPAIPGTARAAAPGSLQLPDEDSEDRSPEPASTAESSSPATDELTVAIAHLNVPAKNAASLVRSVASAVNLCGSCVTAIVQSAVLTLQGLPGLSPLGLASTRNSSVAILNRNLALVAEDLAKCDTTSTTTDLTTSLGCAVDAISTYITRASRHGSNESDLSGPAIQQRMFYTAKADSNERITLPKPGAGDHRSGGNFAGGIRICNVCQNRTKPGNWLASDTRPWPACGHGDWQWGDPKPQEGRIAHPTVKPLSLMRWLVRLVTPPGGLILEPFAGSGTTVEAALLEGFHCIAIEREADYLPLITQRINRRRDPIAYLTVAGDDLGLFG